MAQRGREVKDITTKRPPKASRNQIMEKMEEFSKRTEKVSTAMRKSRKTK
jgi:hypothetical protein